MKRCIRLSGAVLAVAVVSMVVPSVGTGQEFKIVGGPALPYGHLIGNGGFEDGFSRPWGTWVEHEPGPLWLRRGGCAAEAMADTRVAKSGRRSLRISNSSRKAPGCYAETCQVMVTEPDRRYRLTFWAKYEDLASNGAIRFLVGLPEPAAGPSKAVVELPAGSHDWRKFQGEFSFPATAAELRIRSVDRGRVWLDDIQVTPVDPDDDLLPGANTDDEGVTPDALAKQFGHPQLSGDSEADDTLQIVLPSGEVEHYRYDQNGQPIRVQSSTDAHYKEFLHRTGTPGAVPANHGQHSDEAMKRALAKAAAAITSEREQWSNPHQPFPGVECPTCRSHCRLFRTSQQESETVSRARRERRVPPSHISFNIFVAQHRLPEASSRIVTARQESSSDRQVFYSTVLDDSGKKMYARVLPATFHRSRSTTVGSTGGWWEYGVVSYRVLLDATTHAYCGISFSVGSDTPHWTSWQPDEYVRQTEHIAKTVFRVLREELQINPGESVTGLFFPYGG